MSVNASAVANYFLDLSWKDNNLLTHMKIQKLLFFANGFYLALFDEPMINENVEAWEYGPIYRSLYDDFKVFGTQKIDKINYMIATELVASYWKSNDCLDFRNKTHVKIIDILNFVWGIFKDVSESQLIGLIHMQDAPWKKTVDEYGDKKNIPNNLQIPELLIKNYFKEMVKEDCGEQKENV